MQGHNTQRLKIDETTWECECVQCGELFTSTRSDASFCKASCRVAFSREPQKRLNALEEVRAMRLRLNQIAEKYHGDDEVFGAMKLLEISLVNAIGKFDSDSAV